MRRRQCFLLIGGFLAAGCRKERIHVDPAPPEKPWTDLRGKWEGMGGGEIDTGEPLRIGWGETLTAVRWAGEAPKPPFEMELMAKRVDGSDFFCAITFPARATGECVTLIVGGWGGGLVGISSIDGKDASENETTSYQKFETDVWYRIRLMCLQDRITAWIDGAKVVDVVTTGKTLSLRPGSIEDCAPFGLATWQTTGIIRNARWRAL